jgi:HK97 family phage major capsid protein
MYSQGTVLSQFAVDSIGPNSNGMVYNTVDESSRAEGSRWGGLQGYWMNEGGTKTASQPVFSQVNLKLKKIAALCYATDELLEDSRALESWITRTVPDELRFMIEDAILNGNGAGKPLGMLQSAAFIEEPPASAAATAIVAGDLAAMWARRWVGAKDYIWLVDQSVLPSLMGLTIGNFPVYMPPNGIQGTPAAMLFGRPVFEVEYLADVNVATGPIGLLLCAPSQYALIDKGGVQSAKSLEVGFLTDESVFRFVYRIDGAPMWHTALTPHSGGETVSPFIALGSTSS